MKYKLYTYTYIYMYMYIVYDMYMSKVYVNIAVKEVIIRVLYPGRSALHHFHMQNHTLQKEQVCKNHDQMKL